MFLGQASAAEMSSADSAVKQAASCRLGSSRPGLPGPGS